MQFPLRVSINSPKILYSHSNLFECLCFKLPGLRLFDTRGKGAYIRLKWSSVLELVLIERM